MPDIFLSHVEEDFGLVLVLANALEEAGYSAWYYERDANLPGVPHRIQTGKAIEETAAFLLLISRALLDQPQHVKREVNQAVDLDRPIIPLLHDVTFQEFSQRQPDLSYALAGAVATPLPAEPLSIVPRIAAGLRQLGIDQGSAGASPVETAPLSTGVILSERGTPDVFVAYVEEDSAVVTELVSALEGMRYITWFYERDGLAATADSAGDFTEEDELLEVAPVVKLAYSIIAQGIKARATEIHIDPGERQFHVRYLMDGALQDVMSPPKGIYGGLLSRIKIMSDLNIAERGPQRGRVGQTLVGTDIELHVKTVPTEHGEKVLMRILDRTTPDEHIQEARAVVALISQDSLESDDFRTLIGKVRSTQSPLVLVLVDGYGQARGELPAGAAASIELPRQGVTSSFVDQTIRVLKDSGVAPRGRRLELVLGDITDQEVDAIVNAANRTLMGGIGVDGAIHRKGGPQILRECKLIRKEQYPDGLPTGKAVATTAGELPATWVIHTAGPEYSESEDRSGLLRSCYVESLRIADQIGASSIAFPAISAGGLGYPLEEAASIAIDAVKNAETNVAVIRFALFDRETYLVFERALERAWV